MNSRERVFAFLEGRPTDRLPVMPVVMMFCADRIGVKYGDYVRDHRVLAEAQMRTADEFDLDLVSIMSDPAREAHDCGARVQFYDDQPAAIIESDALLADKTRLLTLKVPDPLGGGRMHEAVKGLAVMRSQVGDRRILMGWVEGPCAEAADLRGINTLMLDLYDDPGFVRDLFDFVIEMELQYARAQIEAGADLIGIGDAAASLVGPKFYRDFVWPAEKRLVDGLHALGTRVRLHICGQTQPLVREMGRLNCEIVDLDYFTSLAVAREAMGPAQILLGNLDPVRALRNGTPASVAAEMAECRRQAGDRFIVGAGCEVPRDTPLANFRSMIDAATSTSSR
jgi:MtaA/CmuA family methyltransferase